MSNAINIALVTVVLFLLTRQFPLSYLSPVMNVATLAIFIVALCTKYRDRAFSIILLYIAFLGLYSLFKGNDPLLLLRAMIVMLILVSAHYIVIKGLLLYRIFTIVYLIQALVVICLWVYFTVKYPGGIGYHEARVFFLDNSFGDIYSHGLIYKVQIKGNALLPFAYMLFTFINHSNKCYRVYFVRVIFLLSIILAGNFMFLVAIAIFHILFYCYNLDTLNAYRRKGFLNLNKFILIIFMIPIAVSIFFDVVVSKSELGKTSSMGIRYDQVEVLINDLSVTPIDMIFGTGLGHTISAKTESRDYRGDVYFELQVFYFLNQLGILNFIILFTIMFGVFYTKAKNKGVSVLYVSYISYACSNPYILDTNHVVVIIMLLYLSHLCEDNFAFR